MLSAISGLARWWQRRSLDQVSYNRRFIYRRGFPGESLSLQLEVENRKFLPISWLRVFDPLPRLVGPSDENLLSPTHMPDIGTLLSLFSLRWYERDRRTYELLLRKRGIYKLGPARLESGDLFGLFERQREDDQADYLTVFPQPFPFQAMQLPTSNPFGDRRARRRLYEDPNQPMGVREYQPEDDFRRIHWPATARTSQLMVRVFQPISAQVMVICLNVVTFPHYWEGTDPELLEHLVRVTATLVQHGLESGYRVGLISNGCLAHADQPFRVPPGRSPEQLVHLLTALAGVTPFSAGSFERFLINEATRLPYGATLVIVTGLVDQSLPETILRLRQHGRQVMLFSFARQAPPVIPGVTIYHSPFQG
ncbi:MAG: DUF58 domain-containing protein [Anaerolineales bacterium]|nr:DUF58 domain-containing protein [Anaerolineales bacterium]